ncbi:hypothetical protein [Saccharothrix coeruleofusca]|uniref:Uncharacterized protein n=1 Tax=Saccharothrix coeruleofusca TaxID=33919 RepID=A0A918ASI9_9PSEU|nr:hypothetical protein [Saccharothrix coeruleofusca]GGP70655.1 hypothetical protein GCM10010185_49690 [Saccharothrix coeruleofusca]
MLHARSRQVPTSAAVAVVGVALLGWLAQPGGSPRLAAFAVAVAVAAVSVGLGGHDLQLDRTAAFGWPPRRAGHLLVAGAVLTGLLLAVGLVADPLADRDLVLRDLAGLGGTAALGAVVFGARAAWALPVAWTGVTMVVPTGQQWYEQLLTWPVQPPGTTVATVAALTAAGLGLLAYTALGCRH